MTTFRKNMLVIPLLATTLLAQSTPLPPSNTDVMSVPLVWAEGKAVRCGEKDLSFEGPEPSNRRKVLLPGGTRFGTYGQGASWALVASEDGQKIFRSEDGKIWKAWGVLPKNLPPISQFVPLEKDRIFLFGKMSAFTIGKNASPLAVARRADSGDITLENLEGLEMKEPLASLGLSSAIVPSNAGGPIFNRKYKFLYQMSYSPEKHLVQYPDGFAVVVPHTGWIFLFDNRGRLKKRVYIVKEIDEQALASYWAYEKVILGCRPRKDGSLLIATRSQDAVLTARKAFPILDPASGRPLDPEVALRNDIQAMQVFPEIEWWSLDPSSGKLTQEDSPEGAPRRFPSPERLPELSFTLRWDDTLLWDIHFALDATEGITGK